MEDIITNRIKEYQAKDVNYINALREVMQEITLFALSKTDFFTKAAFCGGTALRIFYNLSRASEDLDFSLINRDKDFKWDDYFDAITSTFKKYGFDVQVNAKNESGFVKSAFIKDDTIIKTLSIAMNNNIDPRLSVKIKMELDINPPSGTVYEYKYGVFPSPSRVLNYDISSLFAGKLHALLAREWIKGRDYYDYIFYLRNNIKPNMELLRNALVQTNDLDSNVAFDIKVLKDMLIAKFNKVDFNLAKKDCERFVNDPSELDVWSKELFIDITDRYFYT